MADASVVAAQRQQAEARKMAKSTKTDVDLKAHLVEAMTEGFDSYMEKVLAS